MKFLDWLLGKRKPNNPYEWKRLRNPPEWVMKAYRRYIRKTRDKSFEKHFIGNSFKYKVISENVDGNITTYFYKKKKQKHCGYFGFFFLFFF